MEPLWASHVKRENDADEDLDPQLCDSGLNFSSSSTVDCLRRGKLPRQDPMSHRIIEKRRRDRMNNCLADLSRLIPPDYLKKGRGRIEKTEIIEMAIRHLKYLQDRANCAEQHEANNSITNDHFRLGYQECLSEVMRYLVDGQGHFPTDALCVQLINHLQRHCEEITKGDVSNKNRANTETNSNNTGNCSNYAIHMQQLNKMAEKRTKPEETTSNDNNRHQKHSNTYSSYGEDSGYPQNSDMENPRLHSEHVEHMDESPEDSINEQNNVYHQGNNQLSMINNGNMIGLNLTESNVDEGGGNNHKNRFSVNNITEKEENVNDSDSQPAQDLRINAPFSPISPSYHHKMHNDSNLRNIRKTSDNQGDTGLSTNSSNTDSDNIHSYKFKNNIKQRFSQSQSVDYRSSSPSDGTNNTSSLSPDEHVINKHEMFHINPKTTHKRRKPSADFHCRHTVNHNGYIDYMEKSSPYETTSSDNAPSVSDTSAYHTNTPPDTDIKDLSFEKDKKTPGNKFYNSKRFYKMCDVQETFDDKMSGIGVPVFALHAKGSFYVPINVDYDTLIPFLGPNDLLELTPLQQNVALHPVTINVNFQSNFPNSKFSAIRTKNERKNWQ